MIGKQHSRNGVWLLVIAALAAGCGDRAEQEAAPPGEMDAPAAQVPAEVTAASQAFVQAWNQSDPAVAAEHFTPDAMAMINGEHLQGHDQIMENWLREGVPMVSNLQTYDVDVEAEGMDYHERGRYSFTANTPDGPVDETGRYEAIWTQHEGRWRIRSVTTTADQPAA